MTKILIFTNAGSLSNLEEGFHNQIKEHAFPTKKRPIVLIKEDSTDLLINFIDNFKDEGLYLIYDKIGNSTLEQLSAQCKNDEVYALVHTYPDGEWRDKIHEITGNERFREGNHILGDQHYYYPVFNCLTDSETNKIDRICNLLRYSEEEKIRRAIQKFVIGCNTPYNDAPRFIKAYEKLRSIEDVKERVESFYNDTYPNKDKKGEIPTRSLSDYTAELTSLRDFLKQCHP